MIVNYKTDYPLCILVDTKEIDKNYFLDKDFKIKECLYLNKGVKDTSSNCIIFKDNKNNEYYPFPKPNKFFRCFIAGSSGSGKTTLMCNLLNILNHFNDKMFVLFISSILDDDKLDKQLKKIFKRQCLKINQNSIIKDTKREIPLNLNDLFIFLKKLNFESCCVVFDDVDSMTNKNVKLFLNNFMNEILERGRSHTKNEPNINCIIIKHEMSGLDTKKLFLECEYVYFNLQVIHKQRLKYICEKFNLESYLNLLIERKNEGDGMCCLSTKYPFYLFTNKLISLVV